MKQEAGQGTGGEVRPVSILAVRRSRSIPSPYPGNLVAQSTKDQIRHAVTAQGERIRDLPEESVRFEPGTKDPIQLAVDRMIYFLYQETFPDNRGRLLSDNSYSYGVAFQDQTHLFHALLTLRQTNPNSHLTLHAHGKKGAQEAYIDIYGRKIPGDSNAFCFVRVYVPDGRVTSYQLHTSYNNIVDFGERRR